MNNSCPSCGAVYNVTARDVGRRIRCKKCSTPLIVTEAGLEVDEPAAAPPPPIEPESADDRGDEGEEVVTPRRGAGRAGRRAGGGGPSIDVMQIFRDFGGIPAVLFGVGAFFVIVFLFMPIIGAAKVERERGAVRRLDQDWKVKERKLQKDKKTQDEINTEREKFYKDRGREELEDDVEYAMISNQRSPWFDRYGMMFGFLLLMAGSLGFMMPSQTEARRWVGRYVLTAQILIIFILFAFQGCITTTADTVKGLGIK